MQILNRWNSKVVFECEKITMKEAVEEANLKEANLKGANLRYADLRYVDLKGVDLRHVNLEGADLRGADLKDVNLKDANLRNANLRDANLEGVDLKDANLKGADLIQITLPFFQAIVQKTHTRIGCKYYTDKEWKNFSDSDISKMDSNALEFWNSYKLIIFSAIDSIEAQG